MLVHGKGVAMAHVPGCVRAATLGAAVAAGCGAPSGPGTAFVLLDRSAREEGVRVEAARGALEAPVGPLEVEPGGEVRVAGAWGEATEAVPRSGVLWLRGEDAAADVLAWDVDLRRDSLVVDGEIAAVAGFARDLGVEPPRPVAE